MTWCRLFHRKGLQLWREPQVDGKGHAYQLRVCLTCGKVFMRYLRG